MIICPCSLKIVWTASPHFIQNEAVSGSSTTVVVMTELGKMGCWWEICERNWGGKQSSVRDMEIKEEVGYLGMHSPVLKVGDIQK